MKRVVSVLIIFLNIIFLCPTYAGSIKNVQNKLNNIGISHIKKDQSSQVNTTVKSDNNKILDLLFPNQKFPYNKLESYPSNVMLLTREMNNIYKLNASHRISDDSSIKPIRISETIKTRTIKDDFRAFQNDCGKIFNDDTLNTYGPSLLLRGESMICSNDDGLDDYSTRQLINMLMDLKVKLRFGFNLTGGTYKDRYFYFVQYLEDLNDKVQVFRYVYGIFAVVKSYLADPYINQSIDPDGFIKAFDYAMKIKGRIFNQLKYPYDFTFLKDVTDVILLVTNNPENTNEKDIKYLEEGIKDSALLLEIAKKNMSNSQYLDWELYVRYSVTSVLYNNYRKYWNAIDELEIFMNLASRNDSRFNNAIKARDYLLTLVKQPKIIKNEILINNDAVVEGTFLNSNSRLKIKAFVEHNVNNDYPGTISVMLSTTATMPYGKTIKLLRENLADNVYISEITLNNKIVNAEKDKQCESISTFQGDSINYIYYEDIYKSNYFRYKMLQSKFKGIYDVKNETVKNSDDSIKSAGAEYFIIASIEKDNTTSVLIKNQADWFVIAGHANVNGEVGEAQGGIGISPVIASMQVYEEDLNVLILAACFCLSTNEVGINTAKQWHQALPDTLILGYIGLTATMGMDRAVQKMGHLLNFITKKLSKKEIATKWFVANSLCYDESGTSRLSEYSHMAYILDNEYWYVREIGSDNIDSFGSQKIRLKLEKDPNGLK